MTDRRSGAHPAARRRPVRRIAASFALAATVLAGPAIGTAAAAPVTEVDLAKYARTAQHDLPEPTRTSGEAAGDLLAKEASAVTYDWDRDTLFVVGDEGTSIVQVSKTGQLIDVMQLSGFADTEGLAYIGNGQFIVSEERERAVHRFTYAKDTTLTRAAARTVDLGTLVGNVGIEGITNDPGTDDGIVAPACRSAPTAAPGSASARVATRSTSSRAPARGSRA